MTSGRATASGLSRRRFIGVIAAAGAAPMVSPVANAFTPRTVTWSGIALGARARLDLQHPDATLCRSAIADCLAEVSRLEAVFSLHRPDSAVARLNEAGVLHDAPQDLRVLLAEALALARLSDGAFDPTVQPLWALYREHFAAPGAPASGPERGRIEAAQRLVDWRAVTIDGGTIRLERPGMALTFNGIAQGYITDRIGDMLRERGFEHVLANLGEELALGPKWNGESWAAGIADPSSPTEVVERVALARGAMATSAARGFSFDAAGRFTHILDPRCAGPAKGFASVTVLSERATTADGLSTALSAASPELARALIGGSGRAYVVPKDSTRGYWL